MVTRGWLSEVVLMPLFVTCVVVAIVLIVCRTVEDKAVVVPMVLSAKSVVDVVESGTVSVVVEIDAGSCPPPPNVTHSATMAPISMRENNASNKTFKNIYYD